MALILVVMPCCTLVMEVSPFISFLAGFGKEHRCWCCIGAHVRTQFRLVMFRPFVGEIIVGKVKMADHTGMLGIFALNFQFSRRYRCWSADAFAV